jgi:two-component system sensor histidine kinase RegB
MPSANTFVSSILDQMGPSGGRPDTPGVAAAQGRTPIRRIPLRALLLLRMAFILGQVIILVMAWKVLSWPFPPALCLGLIAASVAMNLLLAFTPRVRRDPGPWEITAQLAFDVIQLAALLYLTGGVVNPFALLLIAPVTVAGGALPPRHAFGICALAMICGMALALDPVPAAGTGLATVADFGPYRLARSVALMGAMVFAGGYASWSSANGARRELALRVTESVLAREQRLSALGALSAAVAHELGTPLATMTIVATEMAREAPEGSLRDDAILMVSQAKRCRDILRRLAETPDQGDSLHERMTLLRFVSEIVEPYSGAIDIRVEALVTGPPGVTAPDVWRRPEALHAISAIVENAYDFAHSEILVTARFDADYVSVEVRDDGPGFSPAVLSRLGEPYVTSRPGAEGSRTGHVGMGLGFFIAKTLLERSGARVSFANGPRRGAVVTARWPRSAMEVGAARQ